jgi:hypothetical protein
MDENFCAVNLSELLSLNQDVGLSINNSMADMANELAGVGQQRTFMHLPLLYHPGLQAKKYKDLFTKCRTEGISFDMERKTGTLLLLCDEIQSGVISIITIRIGYCTIIRRNPSKNRTAHDRCLKFPIALCRNRSENAK